MESSETVAEILKNCMHHTPGGSQGLSHYKEMVIPPSPEGPQRVVCRPRAE
jgi:hypothetical protein